MVMTATDVRLGALVRNWWMVGLRGSLAVVFGLTLLVWPHVNLPIVVVLFGAYAILDGVWAVASATWASRRSLAGLPVVLEGLVSLTLGIVALMWPFVSRQFITIVAEWGVLTGILEIVTAAAISREMPGHWLLGTAGICSLFLAILVVMLPVADAAGSIAVIGGYAIVFGVLIVLAALRFRSQHCASAASPARSWAA
jgi:uncharacterized membrane protein HdeD (DUF308 family)